MFSSAAMKVIMNIVFLFQIVNTAFFGLLGLVIGSFLNVCIYRIPEGRTIVKGHSMCMTCGHNLGTLDLFPLFSWVLLRGKCRYCGAPIASRYAKIEGLTGIIFVLLAWTHRESYILMNTSIQDFAEFGCLLILLAMASLMIVAMMIMKDRKTGMYRFSLSVLILFDVRVFFEVILTGEISSILFSAAMAGLAAVILLILIVTLTPFKKKSLRLFFSDLFAGKTVGSYFSPENRGIRAMDVLFLAASAAIGFPAAVPCLIAYPLIRTVGKQEKAMTYYGIILALSALIGVLFFPKSIF